MTTKELKQWHSLIKTIKAGEKLDASDYQELLRLNYLVMELAHFIHNDNMLGSDNVTGWTDEG